MKQIYILSCLIMTLFLSFVDNMVVYAQNQVPDTVWEGTYGGWNQETPAGADQTTDGGYIIASSTNSTAVSGEVTGFHGTSDCWMVKLDSKGKMLWEKCYGGSDDDYPNAVASCIDGGSVFAGSALSLDGDLTGTTFWGAHDAWVAKLDDTGLIQWQVRIGGFDFDYATDVQRTADSGYIVAGTTFSTDGEFTGANGDGDGFLAKLTANGTVSWIKRYDNGNFESVSSVKQTADSGYVLCGISDVMDSLGTIYAWVLKLDDTGAVIWQHTYGNVGFHDAEDIIQTPDSGYIFIGTTDGQDSTDTGHGSVDIWCVKIDEQGTLQWSKAYGGSSADESGSILNAIGGGYIFSGYTYSTDGDIDAGGKIGDADYWAVRIDDTGAIVWQKLLGGTATDDNKCIIQTRDTGLVLAGSTNSDDVDVHHNYGKYDSWVVKLKGAMPQGVPAITNPVNIKVYPTHTNGLVHVDMPKGYEQASITMINLLGRSIPVKDVQNGTNHVVYMDQVPAGIYLLQVMNSGSLNTYKILYQPR